MSQKLFALTVLCLLGTTAFACIPPNCNNHDDGTCGNACCMMEFLVTGQVADLAKQLKAGGHDVTPEQFGILAILWYGDGLTQKVLSEMAGWFRKARETVVWETPASRAISLIVTTIDDFPLLKFGD